MTWAEAHISANEIIGSVMAFAWLCKAEVFYSSVKSFDKTKKYILLHSFVLTHMCVQRVLKTKYLSMM